MADPEEPREESAETGPSGNPADGEPDSKSKAEAEGKTVPEPLPGAGTPEGATLREAHRAFEVGNYALVRARARQLESAADPAVRRAAAELLERISIDPLQIVVFLACAAVFGTIVYVWVL